MVCEFALPAMVSPKMSVRTNFAMRLDANRSHAIHLIVPCSIASTGQYEQNVILSGPAPSAIHPRATISSRIAGRLYIGGLYRSARSRADRLACCRHYTEVLGHRMVTPFMSTTFTGAT
jgi:hypothetical protein